MRLNRFRIPAATAGLALLIGTVTPPASAAPSFTVAPAQSGQAVPPNAIRGGQEANGTPLYVCLAPYPPGNPGYHPGKVVGNNCNIGYGGLERVIPLGTGTPPFISGYVTTTDPIGWVAVRNGGSLPSQAWAIGFEANGTALFSCRVGNYPPGTTGLHPGKVVFANGRSGCNFGYGGIEQRSFDYDVLVNYNIQ